MALHQTPHCRCQRSRYCSCQQLFDPHFHTNAAPPNCVFGRDKEELHPLVFADEQEGKEVIAAKGMRLNWGQN